MLTLPIPQSDQIEAMLSGKVYDLLGLYISRPEDVDFRRYLTISRGDLIDYLRTHPATAERYLKWQLSNQGTHDIERLFQEGAEYVVASMDHGKRLNPSYFRSLEEAVAEHVLACHGM